ncbi:MAG: hypothetical protein ACT4PE_16930 [Candidatus Eiseniibacteriota bacterium]
MKRSLVAFAAAVAALGALATSGCGGISAVTADLSNTDREEEDYLASGPDAFVERLGEPDEWKNREEKKDLLMTAVWRCVEGEYREVTWRSRVRESGGQYWAVVEDVSRECP